MARLAPAANLVRLLVDPAAAVALDAAQWTGVLTVARAERLAGSLAWRLGGLALPAGVAAILADARAAAEEDRRVALWEAEMTRRALAPLGLPVVLLKGAAFAAAGLAAGQGRAIGDLDILVPHAALDEAERALGAAGWEWVKANAYDDGYYRRWMHELPPLIHRDRDRMIDVHHTILPPTGRGRVDAATLLADAVPLGGGLATLSPEDMVVHAAAHLIADGDLSGGLRNLWDIDRLCREFGERDDRFLLSVYERACEHGLWADVLRAVRLTHQLFRTPVAAYRQPIRVDLREQPSDALFRRRLLARDGWGRPTRPLLRLGFYVRSHWQRMPPGLLARHLWIKWRRS